MSRSKSKKASQTAIVTAAIRASHLLYDAPVIMVDPFAKYFLNGLWRAIVKFRWSYLFFTRVILKSVNPIRSQVLIRARYCEELLSTEHNIKQCVLLGAGYDSLALRTKSDQTNFFEVDRQEIFTRKAEIIAKHGLKSSSKYVVCDFDHDNMTEKLLNSGYRRDQKTLFTWMGVTYYLPIDSVRNNLMSLYQIMSPNSLILLDYGIAPELLDEKTRETVNEMKKFVAGRGEPMIGFMYPNKFNQMTKEIGFEIAHELTANDMQERYLQNNPIEFSGFSRIVVLKKGLA